MHFAYERKENKAMLIEGDDVHCHDKCMRQVEEFRSEKLNIVSTDGKKR
jgi:hypothetical protein